MNRDVVHQPGDTIEAGAWGAQPVVEIASPVDFQLKRVDIF